MMRKLLALCGALLCASAFAQTVTYTVTPPHATLTNNGVATDEKDETTCENVAKTLGAGQRTCTVGNVTVIIGTTSGGGGGGGGGGPGGSVVYHDGTMNWTDNMSYGSVAKTTSYTDTTGNPPVGTHDILITGTDGGWQPGAQPISGYPHGGFNTTGFHVLSFYLKPSVAGETWVTSIFKALPGGGDSEYPGGGFSVDQFCPGLAVNAWTLCQIPLFTTPGYGIPANSVIFKFGLQEQSHKGSWRLAEVQVQ